MALHPKVVYWWLLNKASNINHLQGGVVKIFAKSIFFIDEPPVSFFFSQSASGLIFFHLLLFIGEPLVPVFFFLVNILVNFFYWGTFCFNFFPRDLQNQFFYDFHHAPPDD